VFYEELINEAQIFPGYHLARRHLQEESGRRELKERDEVRKKRGRSDRKKRGKVV